MSSCCKHYRLQQPFELARLPASLVLVAKALQAKVTVITVVVVQTDLVIVVREGLLMACELPI